MSLLRHDYLLFLKIINKLDIQFTSQLTDLINIDNIYTGLTKRTRSKFYNRTNLE